MKLLTGLGVSFFTCNEFIRRTLRCDLSLSSLTLYMNATKNIHFINKSHYKNIPPWVYMNNWISLHVGPYHIISYIISCHFIVCHEVLRCKMKYMQWDLVFFLSSIRARKADLSTRIQVYTNKDLYVYKLL